MRKIIIFISFMIIPLVSSVYGQSGKEKTDSETADENTDVLNEEGVQSAQRGEYKDAIRQFKKAISIQDAKAAASYNNIAYTYMLSGERKKAIIHYKKALERNPNLLPAMGNIGRLLYETEKFDEAIIYGEMLLQRDPYNAEVREWLPDAYRMAAQRRMEELQNKGTETDSATEPGQQAPPATRPKSEVGFSISGQFRYNKVPTALFAQKYKTMKVSQYGPPSTELFPLGLYGNFWLSPEVQLRFNIQSPPSVMEFPSFVSVEEKMEFIYFGKKGFFGAGILFSQANFAEDNVPSRGQFITNVDYPKRNDVKLGVMFGTSTEYNYFGISIFPRYLFTDAKTGPVSIEYDLSKFNIEFRKTVPANEDRKFLPGHFEMALIFDVQEAFAIEYLMPPKNKMNGHYFGIYDLTIDITFGKIQPMFKKVPTVFGFSITERFYFFELNEKVPRTYGNGFGFFGFDWLKATSGSPFPSYHTNSLIFKVYLKQMLASKIILKEGLGYEISSQTGDYNAFSIDLAAGLSF
ncbi:MAG: tetratricopeptide repeat protein [Leptospirales bacterium]